MEHGGKWSALDENLQGLLSAVAVSYESADLVGEALRRLHATLASAPPRPARWEADALPGMPRLSHRLEGGAIEFSPPEPSGIRVGGSFLLRSMVRPTTSVDLMVEVPSSVGLISKDSKNHVFSDKASLFLSCLAAHLQSACKFVDRIEVEALSRDLGWPCLRVHLRWGYLQALANRGDPEHEASGEPLGKRAKVTGVSSPSEVTPAEEAAAGESVPSLVRAFSVRVIATLPTSIFRPHVLHPERNGVNRSTHEGEPQPATQYYNGRLLAQCTAEHWRRTVHRAVSRTPVLSRLVCLVKTWARRRGLHRSDDGWSGHALTALTCGLAEKGALGSDPTDLASAFRGMLLWLSEHSLADHVLTVSDHIAQTPLSVGEEDDEDEVDECDASEDSDDLDGSGSSEDDEAAAVAASSASSSTGAFPVVEGATFQRLYACNVVLRAEGCPAANLTWNVSRGACRELQHEARIALTALGNPGLRIAAHAVGTLPSTLRSAGLEAGASKESSRLALPVAVHVASTTPSSQAFVTVFGSAVPVTQRWDMVMAVPFPPHPMVVRPSLGSSARHGKRARDSGSGGSEHKTTAEHFRVIAEAERRAIGGMSVVDANVAVQVPWHRFLCFKTEQLLTEAMGDRATIVRVYPYAHTTPFGSNPSDDCALWAAPGEWTWSADASGQGVLPTGAWVCLRLDPTKAFKSSVRGPAAGDGVGLAAKRAAEAFRSLWGRLSQLRRFKDGSVAESALFPATDAEKMAIPFRIVSHILSTHLGIPPDAISCPALRVEELLERPIPRAAAKELDRAGSWCASSEAAFAAVTKAAKRLNGILHDLGDTFPLKVQDVRFVGSDARGTSELPPSPHPLAGGRNALNAAMAAVSTDTSDLQGMVASTQGEASGSASQALSVIDVIIQLEHTNRWPDEPDAILATKAAFYLRMASAIDARFGLNISKKRTGPSGAVTELITSEGGTGGKDSGVVLLPSKEALLVLVDGYAFRLRIHHPREMLILAKIARKNARGVLAPAMIAAAAGSAAAAVALAADSALPVSVDPALEGVLDDDPAAASQPIAGFVNVGEMDADAAGFGKRNAGLPEIPTKVNPAEAARRLAELRLNCVVRPRQSVLMHALIEAHPSLGGAVRLARLWLRSQGLSTHLSQEATELLVAKAYVDPRPCVIPSTASTAFLRFLDLLVTFPWDTSPLLVDLGGEVASDDFMSLEARFRAVRASKASDGSPGGPPMYLVTPKLKAAGRWQAIWTRRIPSRAGIGHLISRANAARAALRSSWRAAMNPEWCVAASVVAEKQSVEGAVSALWEAVSATHKSLTRDDAALRSLVRLSVASPSSSSLPPTALASVLKVASGSGSAAEVVAPSKLVDLVRALQDKPLGGTFESLHAAVESWRQVAVGTARVLSAYTKADALAGEALRRASKATTAPPTGLSSHIASMLPEGAEAGCRDSCVSECSAIARLSHGQILAGASLWRSSFAPNALAGADAVITLNPAMLPRRDGYWAGTPGSLATDPASHHTFQAQDAQVVSSSRGLLTAALHPALPSCAPVSHAARSALESMLRVPSAVNLAVQARKSLLPDFDPAQRLVEELQQRFGSVAEFTLDDVFSGTIGVFLNESQEMSRALSVALAGEGDGGPLGGTYGWLALLDVLRGAKQAGAGLVVDAKLLCD
jgi:hypothetical protein